jgi:thioredoxin 1
MSKPIEVTADNFDDTIEKHKFILIDCWAERCPPCRMLGPIIEELAEKHKGKIVFGKLDVDGPQNRPIAARFGIQAIPTMLVFRDGELVDTFVGLMSKDMLEERLGL